MGEIIISAIANAKIYSLIDILVEEEYFGFRDTSKKYVDEIHDFILRIPENRYRKTKNSRQGSFYAHFKYSRKTHYYITFNVINETYFIENIFSNHEKGYPTYIMGIK